MSTQSPQSTIRAEAARHAAAAESTENLLGFFTGEDSFVRNAPLVRWTVGLGSGGDGAEADPWWERSHQMVSHLTDGCQGEVGALPYALVDTPLRC